jgi:hypothetical protein
VAAIGDVQTAKGKSFIQIPCGCHCLALGIKDFCERNLTTAHAVKSIEEFSKLLKSKPLLSFVKRSRPSHCFTRWTNIYDIAELFRHHMELLHQVFEYPAVYKLKCLKAEETLALCLDSMLNATPLLVLLLKVFEVLSLKLGSNRTSAGCI